MKASEGDVIDHVDVIPQPGNRMPRPIDPAAPLAFTPLDRLISRPSRQHHTGPYVRDLEVHANVYT